jgi:hypothetical protein
VNARNHPFGAAATVVTALLLSAACKTAPPHPVPEDARWLTYVGGDGPGRGKHIVLVAAEQEYRSEQSMPMLAKVLAVRHGFHCTVLFAQQHGLVDPTQRTRQEDRTIVHEIPGLEHLAAADLLILFSRFMTLAPAQLAHVTDYLDSGKPIFALRTANHGFLGAFPYQVNGKRVRFGEDVLGGTFLGHHGNWHADSTRGILVPEQLAHPILRGVRDVWGPSDVYRTFPEGGRLPDGCQALVLGQPLLGRQPGDAPNPAKEPLPVAWTKTWTGNRGLTARVFHLTMGSGADFENEGVRRLAVNAAYWCLGLEDQITADRSVACVGPYAPLDTGFDYERLGVKPRPVSDYR